MLPQNRRKAVALSTIAVIAIVAGAALLGAVAAYGGGDSQERPPEDSGSDTTVARSALSDLKSVEEFQALFTEDDGLIRIVLLVSPT